jgi:hypothetical protein
VRTEGAINPIPIVVHALGIAAGLLVGWMVMQGLTPALPADDVAPGVESSSAPRAVVGDDPDSLFLPNNLADAIAPLQDQLAAGQGVVSLHIEPGSIDLHTSDVGGTFDLADVPVAAPLRITDAIHAMRDKVSLEDIGHMDLTATAKGPRWYVQFDIDRTDVPPPWTYTAPLEGDSVTPGGSPPTPIDG